MFFLTGRRRKKGSNIIQSNVRKCRLLLQSVTRQGWSSWNLTRVPFKFFLQTVHLNNKLLIIYRPRTIQKFDLNSVSVSLTPPCMTLQTTSVIKWWQVSSKIGYFAESVSSLFPSLPWHRITSLSSSNNPSWCDLILNFCLLFIAR